MVGVLGVFDDVARRRWPGGPDGELIYLTRRDPAGVRRIGSRHAAGDPRRDAPAVDLQAERVLAEILVAGSRDGMLTAAHDVADGGVGLALAEMAMRARAGIGARTWVPDGVDAFTFLFSSPAARAVVVVPRSEGCASLRCAGRGFACERIGVVDSGLGEVLQIGDIEVGIAEMRGARRGRAASYFA